MRYLLDTGILLRLLDRSDPLHLTVRESLRLLSRFELVTGTQNIAEFWNVCTRPAVARGGLGLTEQETMRRVRLLERFTEILREPPSAYEKWKSLVITAKVHGKQVHDARIVALMKAYRIRRILTLNIADFTRYSGIDVVTPQQIVESSKTKS